MIDPGVLASLRSSQLWIYVLAIGSLLFVPMELCGALYQLFKSGLKEAIYSLIVVGATGVGAYFLYRHARLVSRVLKGRGGEEGYARALECQRIFWIFTAIRISLSLFSDISSLLER